MLLYQLNSLLDVSTENFTNAIRNEKRAIKIEVHSQFFPCERQTKSNTILIIQYIIFCNTYFPSELQEINQPNITEMKIYCEIAWNMYSNISYNIRCLKNVAWTNLISFICDSSKGRITAVAVILILCFSIAS